MDELTCGYPAGRPFGCLSQGEQQKVLIARARMARPLLLILDEPCAGLDPGSRENLLQSIDGLATSDNSLAIVLVTHHLDEIGPRIGRVLALRDGRVLASGPPAEILCREVIDRLYQAKLDRFVSRGGRRWPIWSHR